MDNSLSVEIVCIGTELLNGFVQDSNSSWLAKEVALLGCDLRRITIVPDDPDAMIATLQGTFQRNTDVVMTSGGLGPTPDDMTVSVVAQMLGVKAVVNMDIVNEVLERRNITDRTNIHPALLAMARVPENAKAYPNPVGIGPCIHIQHGKSTLFLMPGPPAEVQGVFSAHVRPFIRSVSPFEIASRRVVVNMFEAEVGPILYELMKAHPGSYLKGALVEALSRGDTQHLPVDIVCKGKTLEAAAATLSHLLEDFEQHLYQRGKQIVKP